MKSVIRSVVGILAGLGAWVVLMMIALAITKETSEIDGLAGTLAIFLLMFCVGLATWVSDRTEE